MHIMRHALLMAVLLALTGCSYFFGEEGQFRERAMDYKSAESQAPLSLPDGMESTPIKQRYPIPQVGKADFYEPEESDSVPRPQSLLNVNEAAGLELRRDGDQVWLIVDNPVAEVWPRVLEFVESNALVSDVADVESGVIETGWLVPRRLESDKGFWKSVGRFFRFSKKDQKDRFRVQVTANAGQSAESSIVRINHTQAGNPLPAQVKWPKTPANPELVAVVYDELMEFFEDGGRKIGASVLTQDLKALPKYTMTWDGNGFPILVISKDFNYAWLAVGQALARARIGVTDLDRTLGIYYLDEKTKISGKKDEIREVQLRLVNSESGIQVAVQVDDDTVAPKELSANILNRIRENLE